MRTHEEIKKGLEVCTRDGNENLKECEGCPYYVEGQVVCGIIAMMKESLAYIEQLEETIDLMKIQMHGDCGTCKHRNDARVKEDARLQCKLSPACYKCLSSGGRSQWEYEGLPEVKRHAQSV